MRLSSGDVFDHVELFGTDERRDVAALKLSAGDLSALVLGNSAGLVQGDPVYTMTNANGLTWSATDGILSAVRPADEVPGIGSGYRLLQFTDPVEPGSSGGARLDRSGSLMGLITSGKGQPHSPFPLKACLV